MSLPKKNLWVEVVGLSLSNFTFEIAIFVNMWNSLVDEMFCE